MAAAHAVLSLLVALKRCAANRARLIHAPTLSERTTLATRQQKKQSQNGTAPTEAETEVPVEISLLLYPIEAQFLYQALSQGSFPTPQTKQLAASVQLKLEAAFPQEPT